MPEPVDWKLAERVAIRLAGSDPFASSYHAKSLATDFAELTAQAEALVTAETGLVPDGPARSQVVDRADWIRNNISSFQRMLRPVTERLGPKLTGPTAPVARGIAGTEVGSLLGLLSKRVLGQYDLLMNEHEDRAKQDVVSYVGPNILAIEKHYAFAPREFRLWLALHEVTHRAQFTGVPWMREHFLALMNATLSTADPDPKRFLEALKRAVDAVREGRNPLDEGGIIGLLADASQREALDGIGGLMSLLEGHGDVTMDRAGAALLPSAPRFSSVLRQRRQATGVSKFFRQLVGFEAKLRQYEDGERFIAAVEATRSVRFIDRAWHGPENLPTLAEIRDPQSWIGRLERRAATPAGVGGAR